MAKREKIYTDSETGCCKRFDPGPWDGKAITFREKLFLRERTVSFMHIPLNFGSVMARSMDKIAGAGALSDEPLMMCDESSLWGADVFIAVSRPVPGARMEKLSGTFLAKAFEGPFSDIGKWVKRMEAHVAAKGERMKKLYFFYTTCPACAKAYGKNYVVLMAQV
ncbi:MAG TPA: hydrolase [Candidatus Bilamarchaeum sp.]|nr:hydrolase [Candidatus Bilamarchaeum sp.]